MILVNIIRSKYIQELHCLYAVETTANSYLQICLLKCEDMKLFHADVTDTGTRIHWQFLLNIFFIVKLMFTLVCHYNLIKF